MALDPKTLTAYRRRALRSALHAIKGHLAANEIRSELELALSNPDVDTVNEVAAVMMRFGMFGEPGK